MFVLSSFGKDQFFALVECHENVDLNATNGAICLSCIEFTPTLDFMAIAWPNFIIRRSFKSGVFQLVHHTFTIFIIFELVWMQLNAFAPNLFIWSRLNFSHDRIEKQNQTEQLVEPKKQNQSQQ